MIGKNFNDYSGFQQIPGIPTLLQQSVGLSQDWKIASFNFAFPLPFIFQIPLKNS